jgi:hypothetical protein
MPLAPRFGFFWTPRRGVRPYAGVSWRPSRHRHHAGFGLLLAIGFVLWLILR